MKRGRETDSQADTHRDSMKESAQGADSLKKENLECFPGKITVSG